MKHEAVTLLAQYLQIDTTNPPGRESAAADFLMKILNKEGIAYKTYENQPGRVSLRAVIPGTGEKEPLILLNHTDVVAANEEEWSFAPFCGEVRDGFIHGRGALDMKGQGIMELMAFLHVKREGITPCRDLVFLAVADEETGGSQGVEYLLSNHPEDFRAGLVLNEGGFGLSGLLPDRPLHMISSAEKGPCWLKLTCMGPPGHGSMPYGRNSLERLILALNRVLNAETCITLTPVVEEYFRQLGRGSDFMAPYLEDGKPETLKNILEACGLLAMPQISAMLRNTISLNLLQAGSKTNVIPSRAEAHLDIRLLPGQEAGTIIEWVRAQLDDSDIQVEPITVFPATESPSDHQEFRLLTDVLDRHFPGSLSAPSLSAGTTDSRFFREQGVRAYGFCPIVIPMSDIKTIHGIDEKISEENLVRGVDVFTDAVLTLCQTEKDGQ